VVERIGEGEIIMIIIKTYLRTLRVHRGVIKIIIIILMMKIKIRIFNMNELCSVTSDEEAVNIDG
jgi:hypothetical protein